MVGDVKETWEEIKVEPLEFIDAGDKVVLAGPLLRCASAEPAYRSATRAACVYSLLDGKIARVELYRDHEQALEAAGIREAAARSPLARPSTARLG